MKHFFFVLFCLLPFSCSKLDSDAGKKILNIPITDDVNSLDPAKAYDSISQSITALSMESLFQYTYTKLPLELEPLLADGMPVISNDKRTYTIKIKKNVHFQNDPAFPNGTRELKAADFIYAWKRMLIPQLQSPGTWVFDGKALGWDEFRKKIVANPQKLEEVLQEKLEGLQAIDDHTIQIKLLEPYPQLLYVLTMCFGAPVPKEVALKYGHEGLGLHMVGTGPYMVKNYTRGSIVEMVRNPGFRGENYPTVGDEQARKDGILAAAGKALPFLEKINFHIIKEDQPRWLQFLKGNLDQSMIPKDSFDVSVENGELKKELADKGVQLLKGENPSINFLGFNMKDPVVGGKNVLLRRAISKAINREEYMRKFLNGRGVKATSIVPRVIFGNTQRLALENDYDLEGAKALLAKAGFPGGKGLPAIRFDLNGASSSKRQLAEYYQKELDLIGVHVEIEMNTTPAYMKKQTNGNLQFFAKNWTGDFPDAENFLFLFYSKNFPPGPNAVFYSNPAYDRLYETAARMEHSKERVELIRKAENILFADATIALLNHSVTFYPFHSWMKNFRPNDLILNSYKYLDVDVDSRKTTKPKL